MTEPSLDELVAQIEQGIEDRQFAGAREIFNATVKRWGASPGLTRLRLRIEQAEEQAHRPQVTLLEQEAQQQLTRGNYGSAIDALRQATSLLPHDGDLRLALQQAERALARHQSAIAREREVSEQAKEIEAFLAREQLDRAREALREATRASGGHRTLDHLEQRLAKLEQQRLQRIAANRLAKARDLLEANDWPGALAELDRALAEDPELGEAEQLRQQARASLELEQGRRFTQQAIDEARQDVERLLTARELQRADHRLDEAISLLGRQEVFSQLGRRIDEAKAGVQAVRRREWAERRQREATAKLQEADRLLRGKRYQEALEFLRAAERIESELPGLQAKLSTALKALERQQEAQLTAAATSPAPPPERPLAQQEKSPARPAAGLAPGSRDLFLALAAGLLLAELLGSLKPLAPLALAWRLALLLTALACQVAWIRQSADRDLAARPWRALAEPKARLLDLAAALGIGAVCALPLLLLLFWRGRTLLVGDSATWAGWWLALGLGTLGLAIWGMAMIAAAGWTRSNLGQFPRHLRALRLTEVDNLRLLTAAIAVLALSLLARALLGWPGRWIAAVLEAGLLVSIPYFLGLILRKWRQPLAALYG